LAVPEWKTLTSNDIAVPSMRCFGKSFQRIKETGFVSMAVWRSANENKHMPEKDKLKLKRCMLR